jgi:hypothetical protein
MKFDWTSEAIETLHRLTAEGYSASVIGEKMGISKGAVIGKKHRLGACRPHTPRAKPKVTNYVEKRVPRFGKPVNIANLHFFHCKAVVGARKYCGQPVHRRSFCAGHFKLYYQPPKKAVEQTKVFA